MAAVLSGVRCRLVYRASDGWVLRDLSTLAGESGSSSISSSSRMKIGKCLDIKALAVARGGRECRSGSKTVMLCSSTSHPRYATSAAAAAASSGAGYLIHPPYQPDGGLHHHQRIDYSFSNSAAADGGQVDYVQDQCSIHSSATLIFTHPTGSGGAVPQPRKFWDQASASAPDSAGQSKSSHPRTASGRAFGRSSGGPAAGATSKKRKRVATVAQRRAANVRERRRMFNLNEAFDKLRRKVPTFAYEKRLSRIETLRLAITYISFMDQVIRNEASTAVPPAKSTITPPNAAAAAPSCEPIVTSMLAPEHHQRRGDAQHFREASVCW